MRRRLTPSARTAAHHRHHGLVTREASKHDGKLDWIMGFDRAVVAAVRWSKAEPRRDRSAEALARVFLAVR